MIFNKHNLITVSTLFCFCNLIFSCASPIKKSFTDVNDFQTNSNDYDLHVVTKNSLIYFFKADRYKFDNNSLDGFAIIVKDSSFYEGDAPGNSEPESIRLNFSEIDKIIKWGKEKQNFPSFKDETFIMITVGFIGLIIIWLSIKNSIEKDQKV